MDACAGSVVVEHGDVVFAVCVEVSCDHAVADLFECVSAAGFPPAVVALVGEFGAVGEEGVDACAGSVVVEHGDINAAPALDSGFSRTGVITDSTRDPVITDSTKEFVVTVVAADDVISGLAADPVVTGDADDHIRTVGAIDSIVAGCAEDRRDLAVATKI